MHYYYFPTSHWSRVISLVLAEKKLEPARHVVDITKNQCFEPEYITINPKGVVPTIVHEGRSICNSPRIAEYLEDLGDPPLLQNHPEFEAVKSWAAKLDDFPLMLHSYSVWIRGERGEQSSRILDDKVERAGEYVDKYPEFGSLYYRKQAFFKEFRTLVHDAAHVSTQEEKSLKLLTRLAEQVTDRRYIAGELFSFADCIAASILYRLADLHRLDAWYHTEGSSLARYFERLRERPSYRQVWTDADSPLVPK